MKETEKRNDFLIPLSSLGEGRTEFDLQVGRDFFDGMENAVVLDADVSVALDIDKKQTGYELNFGCEGWLEVACDRCLDPVRIPVDTDYRLTASFGDADQAADAPEDHIVLSWEADAIDVTSPLRDTLLLQIPLRCVHPDGECNLESMGGYKY